VDLKALRERVSAVLESVDPDGLLEEREFRGELTRDLRRDRIVAVCRALRDDRLLRFDYLTDITAVDHLLLKRPKRFEVVYHLYSIPTGGRVRLKVPLEESDAEIDSVVSVWPSADWMERETFDMFGIVFRGHPNLTRILMPDGWEGYPLRKDFPQGGVKSFYYKSATDPHAGEPPDLVPRIRVQEEDV
jgi:NADH-quinone oxidoreductase subunit C